jgi:hypothetical protein
MPIKKLQRWFTQIEARTVATIARRGVASVGTTTVGLAWCSFAKREDAEAFAKRFGGELFRADH